MRLILLTLIALSLQGPTQAQDLARGRPALAALPADSRAALQTWLERDCTVGTSAAETARLRTLPPDAAAALLEAHRLGPPPELERTYRAAFEAAFAARNDALAREGVKLFGAQDAAALSSVDRTAYVNRRLAQARLNYRTNAVAGLGIIGAQEALPLLQKIAADPSDPLQAAARQALAQMRAQDARP
jgi:hypothetical protein